MDKNFITCLDHIIELEKSAMIQDKTLKSLEYEMSKMGRSQQYLQPSKVQVNRPVVQYLVQNDDLPFCDYASGGASVGGLVVGIIGLIQGFMTTDGLIGRVFGALFTGIAGGLIGYVGGYIVGVIVWMVYSAGLSAKNDKARREAENKSQQLYEEAQKKAEIQYREATIKYENDLAADAKRVSVELKQKALLSDTYQKLKNKHTETLQTLTKFYNVADIYVTYRNLIAVCHIAEYLKSGICTELTGPDGAFMVFKYEMYEKKKIEQLDTIITQLEQLHFDNQILNSSLGQIHDRVEELIGVVDDVKRIQTENAQRNEQLVRNLGNQLDSYAAQIRNQNSILAYNTECALNELQQLKWLEYYQATVYKEK